MNKEKGVIERERERRYHVDAIDGAQFETLIFRVEYYVYHRAHFRRYDVIGGDKSYSFLQPLLKRRVRSLNASLDHVASHQR